MTEGLSVSDALNLANSGRNDFDGIWNNPFVYLIWIWALRNFDGNRDAACANYATEADIQRAINTQTITNGINDLSSQLCSATYDNAQLTNGVNMNVLQTTNNIESRLCQGFNSVNSNIANIGYKMDSCCCETNRNIDALRYDAAQNTRDIIQASNINTQRILDQMSQNTIQELRDQLQTAVAAFNNEQQTAAIVQAVRPFPIPAYITCSPYTTSGITTGCNSCGYSYSS